MPIKPSIRFRIDFAENSNIGPGKIELLEAIQRESSLSAAARSMKLSYRRAWLLLDSLNRSFDKPVSVNTTGGTGGGGVVVTEFGQALVQRYRELESQISVIAERFIADLLPKSRSRPAAAKPTLKRKSLARMSRGT